MYNYAIMVSRYEIGSCVAIFVSSLKSRFQLVNARDNCQNVLFPNPAEEASESQYHNSFQQYPVGDEDART